MSIVQSGRVLDPYDYGFQADPYQIYAWLREHELQHVRQIQRLGRVRFCVRYVYEMVRYGYWQSPLEEEARHAERENGDRRALAMGYRVPVAGAG